MGTICILLGLIILILFVVAGFVAANAIQSSITIMSLLALKSTSMVYIASIGLCAAIGLLICLNLVMHGLTYNKVAKLNSSIKKITKRVAK